MLQKVKTTQEYRCLQVIHRLRDNKSVLQTQTKENTLTIRGKQHRSATKNIRQRTI